MAGGDARGLEGRGGGLRTGGVWVVEEEEFIEGRVRGYSKFENDMFHVYRSHRMLPTPP